MRSPSISSAPITGQALGVGLCLFIIDYIFDLCLFVIMRIFSDLSNNQFGKTKPTSPKGDVG